MMFTTVLCPRCDSVVFEAGPGYRGLSRHKCHGCRKRVWVSSDGKEIHTGMVDVPLTRLAHSA